MATHDLSMGSDISNIISRIATIEARFTGMEQKSDRIEAILNQLVSNSNTVQQTVDTRIEKEIIDKLDPIKDWLRSDRTKIETLEAGKRYNLATVAVVGGFMFGIFTYYTNQTNEGMKQMISAQSGSLRTDFVAIDSSTRNGLSADITQNRADVAGLKSAADKRSLEELDYQAFKALVTSQNATSIVDRSDKGKQISDIATGLAEINRTLAALTAHSEQKFTEVETQFNADGQLRNVQFSEQQRLNAMHQDALHDLGAKLPAYPHAPFYQPNISQQALDGR